MDFLYSFLLLLISSVYTNPTEDLSAWKNPLDRGADSDYYTECGGVIRLDGQTRVIIDYENSPNSKSRGCLWIIVPVQDLSLKRIFVAVESIVKGMYTGDGLYVYPDHMLNYTEFTKPFTSVAVETSLAYIHFVNYNADAPAKFSLIIEGETVPNAGTYDLAYWFKSEDCNVNLMYPEIETKVDGGWNRDLANSRLFIVLQPNITDDLYRKTAITLDYESPTNYGNILEMYNFPPAKPLFTNNGLNKVGVYKNLTATPQVIRLYSTDLNRNISGILEFHQFC